MQLFELSTQLQFFGVVSALDLPLLMISNLFARIFSNCETTSSFNIDPSLEKVEIVGSNGKTISESLE